MVQKLQMYKLDYYLLNTPIIKLYNTILLKNGINISLKYITKFYNLLNLLTISLLLLHLPYLIAKPTLNKNLKSNKLIYLSSIKSFSKLLKYNLLLSNKLKIYTDKEFLVIYKKNYLNKLNIYTAYYKI